MQPGSLIAPIKSFVPLVNAGILILTGITPEPSGIYTCKDLFVSRGVLCLTIEECELIALMRADGRPMRVDFGAKHWVEITPPQKIDIDELMPKEVFCLV